MKKKLIAVCLFFLYVCNDNILIKANEISSEEITGGCSTTKFENVPMEKIDIYDPLTGPPASFEKMKLDTFETDQEMGDDATQGPLPSEEDDNSEEKSCCPGYNPKIFNYARHNLTQCEPICSNGCPLHQFCIEPDMCVERGKLNNDMCHKITCANGCLYERDEKSKDYCLCPSGYEHTDETICTPVCEKTCQQGYCIAPNVCVCRSGYNLVSLSDKVDICEPSCNPPCANGVCTDPNYCECEPGFSSVQLANGSSICQIPCEDSNCINGTCIDNECQCDSGFQFDDQSKSCLVQCEPECMFGDCVAPNKCVCHAGYAKSPDGDNNICCHESCVQSSGTCDPNDNCQCGPGYKNSLTNSAECVPDCEGKCTQQEECVAPGKCQCLDGYTIKNGTCTPHCDTCDNGNCTAPNVCICDIGYVADASKPGICVPVCDPPCVNGLCIKPNYCSCNAGYGKQPNMTSNVCCDEICLKSGGSCGLNGDCKCNDGYKNSLNNTNECVPECGDKCTQQEVCVAPGICQCLAGYTIKNGTCTPHCDTCDNGNCTAPNVCICDIGFVADASKPGICVPVCDPPCVNGLCIKPNYCSCNAGYGKQPNMTSNVCCEEICLESGGSCGLNGDCKCNDGYKNSLNNTNECVPECGDKCTQQEVCVAPGICQCLAGYTIKNGTCTPHCDTCDNGNCTAPNVCICDIGFVADASKPGICVPVCDPLCVNGLCIKPNYCSCNAGYGKQPNMTSNVCCDEICLKSGGSCGLNGDCKCNDGYKNSLNNTNECVPECGDKCTQQEVCVAPGICQCLAGYTIKNGTCTPHCDTCDNGNCTPPNVCICDIGFVADASKPGICVPVCDPPCVNGLCIKPNYCSCNAGYGKQPNMTSNVCCDEICLKSGGSCGLNGDCKCNDGYKNSLNNTNDCVLECGDKCTQQEVCVAPGICQCLAGYTIKNGTCTPHCDTCDNGNCTAPNVCICDIGFVADASKPGICVPVCDPPCVNGLCIKPNYCSCNAGYGKQPNMTSNVCCEEICLESGGSCGLNGDCKCNDGYKNSLNNTNECVPECGDKCTQQEVCVAPGICQCLAGYTIKNGTCTPHCDTCDNGNCTAPNVCICDIGFVADASKPGICVPVCDPPCVNGLCIKPNYCSCNAGYGKQPNMTSNVCCDEICLKSGGSCGLNGDCKCNDGYKNSLNNTNECVPECGDKCTQQEVCVAPGICQCLAGYTIKNGTCTPHCDTCDNGNCTAPNVCICDIGFVADASKPGICVPVCDPPCVNGLSIKPNYCSCNAGYGKQPNMTSNVCCDEICLKSGGSCGLNGDCKCNDGYKNSLNNTNECVPECGDKCTQQEVCVAPGICQCLAGYTIKNGTCTPHCDTCDNGNCTAPNVCICDIGFVADASKPGICVPVCDPPCVNGLCIKPNYCSCNAGYGKQPNMTSNVCCDEICLKSGGSCGLNGDCKCNDGYKNSLNNTNDCVPECGDKCTQQEVCVAPGICQCLAGYTIKNGTCTPHCDTCDNGNCTAPNVCICDIGFVADASKPGICVPVCDPPCVNGLCIKPNYCSCNAGYGKQPNMTSNVCCDEICLKSGGSCGLNGDCKCNDGYKNSLNNTNECVPECGDKCTQQEVCVAPGICQCLAGYTIKNGTCTPHCDTCDNGNCTAPNVCICDIGFVADASKPGICVPVCDPPCVNGLCIKPNYCACNAGYGKQPNMTSNVCCDEICLKSGGSCGLNGDCKCNDGYKNSLNNTNDCVPECGDKCTQQEVCVAPGICQCLAGYTIKNGTCTPHCDTCDNGNCTAPNVCICDIGFVADASKPGICVPVCDPPCVNGLCIKPNYCACNAGYGKQPNMTSNVCCDEICLKSGGSCGLNGDCKCNDGYKNSLNNTNDCVPECGDKCTQQEVCVAPGICQCLAGYTIKNGTCTPHCDTCDNGNCTAPNVCICDIGFVADASKPGICVPVCDPPCVNGLCIKPNYCSCNAGYGKQPNMTSNVCCDEICLKSGGSCGLNGDCKCNDGYKNSLNNTNECVPECGDKCTQQEVCVAPGICQCLAGYTIKNGTCTPHCDTCDNGNCTAPNVCICDIGFVADASKPGICVPVCDPPCVNGLCIKPNYCSCNAGYGKQPNMTSNVCCDEICLKSGGSCGLNGDCKCNDGYKNSLNNTNDCVPECGDKCTQQEVCVAPGICQCLAGYTIKNGTCTPHCDTCDNGNCTAPNVCICDIGFVADASKPGICVPVCDPLCVNGLCIKPNYCSCNAGYGKQPNMTSNVCCDEICLKSGGSCGLNGDCKCYDGYKNSLNNTNDCVPECGDKCTQQEVCVAPGICQCLAGYTIKNGTCTPHCDTCDNGNCTAPNVCICDIGFVADASKPGICVPVCDPLCVNGLCIKPNYCSCNAGYGKQPNLTSNVCCDEICLKSGGSCGLNGDCKCNDGYKNSLNNTNECVPECGDKCTQQEVCVAPGICQCLAGYTIKNGTCTPHCDTCDNGNCTAPNVCICDIGFVADASKPGICVPVCDPPCVNGLCIKPNYCSCKAGYGKQPNMTSNVCCDEICLKSGGSCGLNGDCKCNDGYKNSLNNTNDCVPECGDKCTQQEVCVAPGICQCLAGYTIKNGTCTPHCDTCDNGNCTAPNVCICDIGFVADASKPGICVPVCDPPCVNGLCIKPNYCACNAGYGKQPNVTSNVCCDEICLKSSGSCGLNGECECSDGYKKSLNNSTECVPDCENKCGKHEVCGTSGKCQCLDGYVKGGNDVCSPHCQYCENGYCIEPNNCVCDHGFVLLNGTCISNILRNTADIEERVALWCVLRISKRITDVTLSFENHEKKFSCHSTEFCQISCDVDEQHFTANRNGFMHCNVTAGAVRESGQLICYGVNFPSTTIQSHEQCPSTLINQTEHQSVYAFFVNFTMAEKNSHGTTDNCSMCPCSQETNVSVFGVSVEAHICPCTPKNSEQPRTVGIDEKYISRIYPILLTVLICLLMIVIIHCIRSRMCNNKYHSADIANVPTNSELLEDDGVKLNHVKYDYPKNNNSNSNDYKIL